MGEYQSKIFKGKYFIVPSTLHIRGKKWTDYQNTWDYSLWDLVPVCT